MKQERFEKVVEGDLGDLINAWLFGGISIIVPIAILIEYNIEELSFLDVVSGSFINGIVFIVFVHFALNYVKSRKVYWRKKKNDR